MHIIKNMKLPSGGYYGNGHEISKTRPVIVVFNDINNKYSGTVTIIPVTSRNVNKIYPFEVYLPKETTQLEKNSKAKTDQIRTIDKARLIKLIGMVDCNEIKRIDQAISIHLNLKQ